MSYDLAAHTIRLHDVIRTYLQWNINAIELPVLHGQLLDAYDCKRWAELPYLWDHLAEHLIDAGRCENLIATVKDGSYLATKICARGVFSVEADLDRAERQLPTDTSLRLLKRSVVHMDHILNRCQTVDEAKYVLYSRLAHLPDLRSIYNSLEQELPRPFLVPWHPLPDLPHAALIRTLQGHLGMVNGCAVSPAGDYIVSASDDWMLKVWDAATESCIAAIYASFGLFQCAFLPDGEHLVAVGDGGIYFLYLTK